MSSIWKASKLYSILNLKCPRCHEGDLFPKGTLYSPKKFNVMYEVCPCCGRDYEPEPGYFIGATYFSIVFYSVIFMTLVFVLNLFMVKINFAMVIAIILVVVFGMLPIIFRYSRAIWMNLFMKYEGPCREIRKL